MSEWLYDQFGWLKFTPEQCALVAQIAPVLFLWMVAERYYLARVSRYAAGIWMVGFSSASLLVTMGAGILGSRPDRSEETAWTCGAASMIAGVLVLSLLVASIAEALESERSSGS